MFTFVNLTVIGLKNTDTENANVTTATPRRSVAKVTHTTTTPTVKSVPYHVIHQNTTPAQRMTFQTFTATEDGTVPSSTPKTANDLPVLLCVAKIRQNKS
jgi:hypothetical protein